MLDALFFAHEALQPLIDLQEELRAAVGKPKRDVRAAGASTRRSTQRVRGARAAEARRRRSATTRQARALRGARRRRRTRSSAALGGRVPGARQARSASSFDDAQEAGRARDDRQRAAGASTAAASTDVRPITCEVGVLPRTHGSALFTRGETQALVVDHARHVVRRAADRRARSASTTRSSCCTTTSRRSASAR